MRIDTMASPASTHPRVTRFCVDSTSPPIKIGDKIDTRTLLAPYYLIIGGTTYKCLGVTDEPLTDFTADVTTLPFVVAQYDGGPVKFRAVAS